MYRTMMLELDILKKFKEYKRLIKYKRTKYRESLTEILSKTMETDPQAAWKIIHELKNESLPSDKAEKINRTQWYKHFKDLLKNNSIKIENERQNQIRNELLDLEEAKQCGNLDYDITVKEVMEACKKLKNNKSSSYDMIKNEMLRSALPSIKKPITKIFNILLKSDQFPESWTEGIIVPIHKQGNSADPNNYRGITISSCLSKLFCHVLNDRISKFLEDKFFLFAESKQDFARNIAHRTKFLFLKQSLINILIKPEREINYIHVLLILEKLLIQYVMMVCC